MLRQCDYTSKKLPNVCERRTCDPDHGGARWHLAKALKLPENITLLKLPPYALELTPKENVWAHLRANKRAIPAFDSHEDILNKCENAWSFFETDSERVSSITPRE